MSDAQDQDSPGAGTHSYFVTAARGMPPRLAAELEALGCRTVRVEPGGCRVRGPLSLGYRICLWSRLASRVLLHLADFPVREADELYAGVRALAWEDHFAPGATLAVDYVGQRAAIEHGQFGAQRTKDAIVDRLREVTGERPDVDLDQPDLRINVFARGAGCSVALDLSGESLHRRGWRRQAGAAPLKETVAAAMLVDAGWVELAASGAAFVDPMAGSGTIVFEALAMAADVAPALLRERFGFLGWRGHEPERWKALRAEARERADVGLAALSIPIVAADSDVAVLGTARANAEHAGFSKHITFARRALSEWTDAPAPRGLVACNPPYGHRLGDRDSAREAAGELGRCLTRVFKGWRACVLLGDERFVTALGSPPTATRPLDNGSIEALEVVLEVGGEAEQAELGRAFANRVRKNVKKLGAWRKRENITCYRLYDADIPEANVAVDRYEDWIVLSEYEAPATVDPEVAQARLHGLIAALPEATGVGAERLVIKQRRRQRGTDQYGKQGEAGERIEVREGGHRFLVNLEDYLDTGLFLDHRPVRQLVAELVSARKNASFLNLFSYTGTATVYAIAAGARRTCSVDLSATYLAWAQDNLSLAGAATAAHRLVRDDVRRFLNSEDRGYDVILLDPPTFSTSKAMKGTLDILRDHVELIDAAMARLAPGGELIFSTNARRFKIDAKIAGRYALRDVSEETIPPDFSRNQRIHRCFRITRR